MLILSTKSLRLKDGTFRCPILDFDAAVNAVQLVKLTLYGRMTKTKEREKVFTMSDTYYDTKVVIATTKAHKISKYDQLTGKTVGVKNGTAAQRFP